jgi:ABC-type nitrate/sulfonate/bicarbonate transport system substrate-binding protein
MYNRVGLVVPADAQVQRTEDLRGRSVAVPFGSAAQRNAVEAVAAAGLDPRKDVTFTNLGIEEILGVVRAGASGGRWGTLDAVAAWDPGFAEIERSGARTLATGSVLAVVAMDDAYRTAHAGAEDRLMEAMATAWAVYRADPARADAWFIDATKLPFSREVLTVAASVEPNVTGPDPVRVHLDEGDRARLVRTEAAMRDIGLLKQPLDVTTVLRPSASVPHAPGDTASVTVRP